MNSPEFITFVFVVNCVAVYVGVITLTKHIAIALNVGFAALMLARLIVVVAQ